jgi:hypothetical protein
MFGRVDGEAGSQLGLLSRASSLEGVLLSGVFPAELIHEDHSTRSILSLLTHYWLGKYGYAVFR